MSNTISCFSQAEPGETIATTKEGNKIKIDINFLVKTSWVMIMKMYLIISHRHNLQPFMESQNSAFKLILNGVFVIIISTMQACVRDSNAPTH